MLGQILLIVSVLASSHAYSTGAPTAQCTGMTPNHQANAQSSAAPYTITPDKTTFSKGDTITVTITGNAAGNTLQGLLLQVRPKTGATTTPIGTFAVGNTPNVKTITCTSADSAITHSAKLGNVARVAVTWTAPSTADANVEFIATLVKEKVIFWTMVKSAEVTYMEPVTSNPTGTTSNSTEAVTNTTMASSTMAPTSASTTPTSASNHLQVSLTLLALLLGAMFLAM